MSKKKAKKATYVIDTKPFEIITDAMVTRSNEFSDCAVWTETDWGCALAGEVGELCNMLKKRLRNKKNVSVKECGKEMADTLAYLFLISEKMGVDLGKALIDKFNEVSKRRNCNMRMVQDETNA